MQALATASGPRSLTAQARETVAGILLLAPGLALLGVFILAPIGYGVYVSLHEFSGIGPMTWIGGRNFRAILDDPGFRAAIAHTALFALMVVVGKNVLGFLLAVLVNQRLRGIVAFRTMLFLPVTLHVLVIGTFWSFFLNSNNGLLNRALAGIGLGAYGQAWLSDERFALATVAFVEVWRWLGLHMLIYLAGLQDIPPDLQEAARLDGAGAPRRLWDITIPLLKPIIFVSTLLALMGAFVRSFDLVWILTRSAAGTDVALTHIYNEAFQFGRLGRASAMGYVLFVIVAAISLVYVRAARGGRGEY